MNMYRFLLISLIIGSTSSYSASNRVSFKTGLSKMSATEIKSDALEFGVGYQFHPNWLISLNQKSAFRDTASFSVVSQTTLTAEYRYPMFEKLSFTLNGGIHKTSIENSKNIADSFSYRRAHSGIVAGAGVSVGLNQNTAINFQFDIHRTRNWSSNLSSNQINVTYSF